MLNNKLFILLIPALLSACTVTGPADDGFDRDNEWVDNGRLLSNDSKTIYNSERKQGSNTLQERIFEPENDKTKNVDPKFEIDYSSYEQWLQAKDQNTLEYQKFQQWKKFEEFERWKLEQKTK